MRKLYNEFFYIPKHGKVREKVMLTHVATMISIILICLAAMGITAYAYFSCNITSGPNNIRAAGFEAKLSIASNGADVAVTKKGHIQTADLEAGKYTIELSPENSTAQKGFCVITIGEKKYYTDQLGVDAAKKITNAGVKFELELSAPAKMEVCSHWGTSACYGYKDADRTEIFIENNSTLDLTAQTQSEKPESGTDLPEDATTPNDSAAADGPAPEASEDTPDEPEETEEEPESAPTDATEQSEDTPDEPEETVEEPESEPTDATEQSEDTPDEPEETEEEPESAPTDATEQSEETSTPEASEDISGEPEETVEDAENAPTDTTDSAVKTESTADLLP